VGISTTTPYYNLTVASTTGPQLSLSAGAGIAQWVQRNAGGNLYFATTTVAGTATTTVAAFSILGTSGNIGIATTSPTAKLSLQATISTDDLFQVSSTTGASLFKINNYGALLQRLTVRFQPNNMFDTFVALGTIAIQIFIIVMIIAWIMKAPLAVWIAKNSTRILALIFISSTIGSFIYQYGFGYEPCLLCWYQRIAIIPIAILSLTGTLTKSSMLRRQIVILASIGFAIALFHNYIDIFPGSGLDVCGASGVSCLMRYVYEFGYITIPMMSATVLLTGILLPLIAARYPQAAVADSH
jgi:disulfide bond formation protein DsbB